MQPTKAFAILRQFLQDVIDAEENGGMTFQFFSITPAEARVALDDLEAQIREHQREVDRRDD